MRTNLSAWLLLLVCALGAHAAGPRFVTGKPFFTGPAGVPIGWRQQQLLYSTDPGDLSATVNHAAADALVAAAAAVWNLPVASITVAQGQPLAEHVSGQNVYFDATALHFPADVAATNAAAIPLSIVYDTDGSVTDTLLGAGASSPGGCRQNAVTESVDAFNPAGYITHAIIVINGRCTGTAPAAQLQLRYQLQRVFGRVLGLAWSQTNDNVFTGTPQPTPVQAQNWPVLHPIDIICGLYTYQCLPNPFTLRPDDIAAMVLVYPVTGSGPVPAGKQLSYAGAQGLQGRINFPTGEGMAGVNVLVRRMAPSSTLPDAFYVASGVTGVFAERSAASPFIANSPDAMGSQGSADPGQLGFFFVPWFPMLGTVGFDERLTSAEPVNPLYTGEYTLGPYPAGNVAPSGTLPAQTAGTVGSGVDYAQFTSPDAASTCGNGADGTPTAPMPAAQTGSWNGLICGFGHVSYVASSVRPGRTFTLEVTALDAAGLPTTTKLMPVLGLYAATDNPSATLPSLAATTAAFNGLTPGTTTLQAGTGSATSILFGIADQRGDGRPDYPYQARLFYADSIAPAQIAATGGTATLTGTGFRNGNAVTVNGVAANVLSWTATAIVVQVPAGTAGQAVDVTVSDRTTGAVSTMTAALTYSASGAQPASMRLISAPAGTLLVGDLAATPFTVELVGTDGVTPIADAAVSFTASAATFTACNGAAACTLHTDSNGLAGTQLTPSAAGPVTLEATAKALSQAATFTAIVQATQMNVISIPESPLHVGIASGSPFGIQEIGPDHYHSLPTRAITFTVTAGAAIFDACQASPCTLTSNYFGQAGVSVIPLAPGPITVRASDGDLSQTITVQALSSTDILTVTQAPPAQFYTTESTQTFAVTLFHADGVTPDPLETITFTAPPGIHFGACATSVCSFAANGGGVAAAAVTAAGVGTYTVQAAYGSITQSVTFTVLEHHWQLKVLSAPADGSPTGVPAAQPFQVQVVLDDGVTPAPIAGNSLILGGDTGAVLQTTCPFSVCEFWVGADATATAWIIPQQPGPLTLSAIYAPLVATATFSASGGTRTMQIVSQPADGASTTRESDLSLQVLDPAGKPLSQDLVSFNVLSGPYLFYEGYPTFSMQTDGNGIAFVPGLAIGYGPVVIEATDGFVSKQITFLAGTPPRVLKLTSTPTSPSLIGTIAARPFAIQVFAQDGITPVASEQVTFTLTGGVATMAGCSVASCVVTTDAQGNAFVQVTPLAAGLVGLLATDGYVTLATTFQATAPPDVLRVSSAPASGSFTGVAAPTPFDVQVLLADGVTPAAGRSIVVSVAAGAATLAACATPTCTLVSDSNGMISIVVTPTAPGAILLQAADGQTLVTASFTAAIRPGTLVLVTAPGGTAGVGYAASTPFTVRLLLGDGTPDPGKTITFSAPLGSVRLGSGSAISAADGTVSTTVTPLAAGPVTLIATAGSLSQSASFTAADQPDILKITSVPLSGGMPGILSVAPFTVQVRLADGVTPAAGRSVVVSASPATLAACSGNASCTLVADANGLVSTAVTATSPGTITLEAVEGQTTVSATFTAAQKPDTLRVLSAPAGQQGVGYTSPTPFTVQLLQGDGTPDPGKTITFAGTQGTVRLSCGSTACTAITAADGSASTTVTPLAAGPITLTASAGILSESVTFAAASQPAVLRITSFPASGGLTGVQAAVPFAVQVLLADGVTPSAAQPVTFTVAAGTAALAACAPCAVSTDSTGIASTLVTPTSAGIITLVATVGSSSISASFAAIANQYTLTALNPALYLAEGTTAELVLSAQARENGQPAASQAIAWTGTPALHPGSQNTLTDSTGSTLNPSTAGPLAAGAQAQGTACAWAGTCIDFSVTGVSADEYTPTFLTSGTILITDAAGHPIAGAPLTVYQTVTAYTPCPAQGRCPAAPVLESLVTAAAADSNGRYTFTPLTVPGVATETEIAVSSGTSGFTTTTVQSQP